MSSNSELTNLKDKSNSFKDSTHILHDKSSPNISAGFKETLIINNRQKTSVTLKIDRTICPKIYSLHDKLETKYQIPSQLPYVTGLLKISTENVDNYKSDKNKQDKSVKSNKNTKKTFKSGGTKRMIGKRKRNTKKLKTRF